MTILKRKNFRLSNIKKTPLFPEISSKVSFVLLAIGIFICGFSLFYIFHPLNNHYLLGSQIQYGLEGEWENITLPHKTDFQHKSYVQIDLFTSKPTHPIKVICDDCFKIIEINEKPVSGKKYCGWDVPRKMAVPLNEGYNKITFEIENYSESGYFYAGNYWGPQSQPFFFAFIALGVSLIFFSFVINLKILSRYPKYQRIALAIVPALGIALMLLYLCGTHYNERSHDIYGHLKYVDYLLENREVPHPMAFWGAYHPPLYYVMLSKIKIVLSNFKLNEENLKIAYQFFSFILVSLGSLLFWHSFIKVTSPKKGMEDSEKKAFLAVLSGSFVIFFLPAIIFISARINNDALFYFFFALIIWLLISRGNYYYRVNFITIISFLTFLAALSKKHALLLLPIELWFWLKQKNKKRLWQIFLIIAPLPIAIFFHLMSFKVSSYDFYSEASFEKSIRGFINEAQYVQIPGSSLKIATNLEHLLSFSPKRILETPFINIFGLNRIDKEKFAGNYFLEYLFRSSLFGEFGYPNLIFQGRILAFSFLTIIFVILIGLIKSTAYLLKNFYSWDSFFAFLFIGAILASTLFRLKLPYYCTQDFRYISFIVFPMAYLYFRAFKGSGTAGSYLSLALILLFAIASISFILGVILN